MALIWQWALAVGSLLPAFSSPAPPILSHSCPLCHPQGTGGITCLFVPFVIQTSQLLGSELGGAVVWGLKADKRGSCEGECGGFLPETTKPECWPSLPLLITDHCFWSFRNLLMQSPLWLNKKKGNTVQYVCCRLAAEGRVNRRPLVLIHWKWQQRFRLDSLCQQSNETCGFLAT